MHDIIINWITTLAYRYPSCSTIMVSAHVIFWASFYFYLTLLCIEGVFNNAIIPHALGGYELIIANSVRTPRWPSIVLRPTCACGIIVNYCWFFCITPFRRDQNKNKNLTNRFHVVVRLFSNRSQMTSKCGNKKVAHEAIAEYITDVLATFWRLLWSITEQTHGNMESIC